MACNESYANLILVWWVKLIPWVMCIYFTVYLGTSLGVSFTLSLSVSSET